MALSHCNPVCCADAGIGGSMLMRPTIDTGLRTGQASDQAVFNAVKRARPPARPQSDSAPQWRFPMTTAADLVAGRPLVFRNATVLTMNDAHQVLTGADVLVTGERIAAIGHGLSVPDGTVE